MANFQVEEKQPFLGKKLLLGLFAVMLTFVLGACGDDNTDDNALDNDSMITNPGDNEVIDGTGNGTGNQYDDNVGTDQNRINEGSLNNGNGNGTGNGNGNVNGTGNDNGTFEDEANDIIDDTEDMIRGKDGNINNP